MNLNIKLENIDEITDLINKYPTRVAKIAPMAINIAARGISTDVVKEITGKYTVKAKDVRTVIAMRQRASIKNATAIVAVDKKSLGLEDFKINPKRIGKRKPKLGITSEIIRGKRHTREGSFLASVNGGKLRVFRREGKARLPIVRQWGGNVIRMLDDKQKDNIMLSAKDRLIKNYTHLINEGFKHVKGFKK